MLTAFVLAAVTASAPAPAVDAKPARFNNPKLDCTKGFVRLVGSLESKPGLEQVAAEFPKTGRFMAPSERAFYTFTIKGNPAHPIIVRQQVVLTPGGGVSVEMLSCGYGDRPATQTFMNQFPKRNEALRQAVASGHSPFGEQASGVANPK